MYKELEKYKTGEKINKHYDEYKADLGDLLNDFIKHKSKPFWKRNYYHDHLTNIYIDMLNKFTIIHGL